MSKRKISTKDKIYAVNLYLDGKESQRQITSILSIFLQLTNHCMITFFTNSICFYP